MKEYAGSEIIVGEPYGVYSVDEKKIVATKFPIYVNGKCVQILDVFEYNGKLIWSATISDESLKRIDELREKKGKFRFEVQNDPNGGAPTLSIVRLDETMLRSNQDTLYSDINRPVLKIKVDDNREQLSKLKSENYSEEKILPMNPKEFQGAKPWCAAYAGARILSYEFSTDIRAKDIMEWVYWTPGYKPDLDDKSLSDDDLIRYAEYSGSEPYYVNRSLYRDEIMEEICNYRMVYAGGKNLKNSKSLHAMVVYGYEKDKYYYYWNPWGELLKSTMDSNILKTENGTEYDWIDSIRNFTWK